MADTTVGQSWQSFNYLLLPISLSLVLVPCTYNDIYEDSFVAARHFQTPSSSSFFFFYL